jgi:hypothetical protein
MEVTTGILVIFVYPKQIPIIVQNKEYGEGADINTQNMHKFYVHTLTGYIDNRKKSSHTEATVEVLMDQKSQNFVAGLDTYSTVFLSSALGTWD